MPEGKLLLLDRPHNADFGVFGPEPFIEHHYREGGVWRGNTELPVCMVLYALALANRAKVIVETGLNRGGGATLWLAFAAVANQGVYHGIDIDNAALEMANAAINIAIPQAKPILYKGNALDVLPGNFAKDSIDFLFLDDDHHRAQVEQELAAFLPLIRPGGLMLLHDVLGIHESDVWGPIATRGGIRLITHAHFPDKPFGGLGLIQRA